MKTAQRLALASIAGSALLSLLNIAIGLKGGSTSVTAAGFEFAGDVLASFIVFMGMQLAAKPADEDHPYGHGRIEILAGLWVGVILSMAGVGICFHAARMLVEVHTVPAPYTIWPVVFAIGVKAILSSLKFHYGRKIGSGSLVADAWNDAVDILSGCAAITALLLTLSDPERFLQADSYGGLIVGLIVIFTGFRVVRAASFELIDTMPSPEMLEKVRRTAMSVEGVWGIDKVMARKTGLKHHVDLHVEVDPSIPVSDAHLIGGIVRSRIKAEVDTVADVLIHVEPGTRALSK